MTAPPHTSRQSQRWITRTKAALFLICLLLTGSLTWASSLPVGKSSTYLLPVGDHDLREVLANFGKVNGITVNISPEVSGSVQGTGQLMPPVDFINLIAARSGLSWFTFRDTVYFARNQDSVETIITVRASQQASLRAALVAMKLLDEKFTWTEIPDQNQILIYGPSSYIQLVRQKVARFLPVTPKSFVKAPTAAVETMIFKLKYASASDRSSESSGGTEFKPGVASILNSLYKPTVKAPLSSTKRVSTLGRDKPVNAASISSPTSRMEGQSTSLATQNTSVPAITSINSAELNRNGSTEPRGNIFPLGKSTELIHGSADEVDGYPFRTPTIFGDEQWPTIEADPRTNSVFVRDRPSRRSEYERLIASLDTPTQQIELETILVDMQEEDIARSLAKLPQTTTNAGLRRGPILITRGTADALLAYARAISKRGRSGHLDLNVVSQTVIFRQDEPFNLDFSDDHIYPQFSDPLWKKFAAEVVSIASQSEPKIRTTALKLMGTASFVDGKIQLQATIEESRNRPDIPNKAVDRRHTGLQMSVGLQEGEVCILSNTTFLAGSDMGDSRGRLVLLSAHRFGSDAD